MTKTAEHRSRTYARNLLINAKKIMPGLVICLIIILISIYLADWLGQMLVQIGLLPKGSASPVSSIFLAIIIGIMIRNTIGINNLFKYGVDFSVKYALRTGIILLGLRLSLLEALKLGAWGIPLIIVCIGLGLSVTILFTKILKQSRRLGTLIACGTGICGVTAIMATSPVIKAKDNEISYAIANITIFGLIGMIFYPYVGNIVFSGDPVKTGLFLGTAIHDTAQVTGSALMYHDIFDNPEVINIAMVTKLTRNLFIIAVIPFVSYLFYKNNLTEKLQTNNALPKWYKFIPLFVVGFLVSVILRTTGDMTVNHFGAAFGILSSGIWEGIYQSVSSFGSTYLLGMAMAGVGLSTNFKSFKGIGLTPFYIGFIAALSVGVVSMLLITLFGHLVVI